MSNLHTLVDVLIHLKDNNANPDLINKFSSFINDFEDVSKEFVLLYPQEKTTTTPTLS